MSLVTAIGTSTIIDNIGLNSTTSEKTSLYTQMKKDIAPKIFKTIDGESVSMSSTFDDAIGSLDKATAAALATLDVDENNDYLDSVETQMEQPTAQTETLTEYGEGMDKKMDFIAEFKKMTDIITDADKPSLMIEIIVNGDLQLLDNPIFADVDFEKLDNNEMKYGLTDMLEYVNIDTLSVEDMPKILQAVLDMQDISEATENEIINNPDISKGEITEMIRVVSIEQQEMLQSKYQLTLNLDGTPKTQSTTKGM
jgi:hypothetical protein